jgi:pilus assembly protein CpaC
MLKIIFYFILFPSIAFSQEESAAPASPAGQVEETQIEMVLGIDKIVTIDFIPFQKLQIGNENLVSYTLVPQNKEIIFKGLKPGRTSVTVRNTVGDIKARYLLSITASDLSNLVLELKQFLGHIEGLEIGIKGDSVYLGGQIVVPSDYGIINLVLKKYADKGILDMVELSPQTQRMVAQKMEEEIQKNGMKDVTVRIVNKSYWLEGVVKSKNDKALAVKIAIAFLPENVASLAEREGAVQKTGGKAIIQDFIVVNEQVAEVEVPKMVKIITQFVELSKDYSNVFGFKWVPVMSTEGFKINLGKQAQTAAGGEATNEGSIFGTVSNLLPRMAAIDAAGYAKILQSGVIIVKDKVQAQIQKMLKQPFSLGTGEFTRAESADAGFDLKVTPTILSKERIDMNIGVNVSSLDGEPPTTRTNNVTTQLILKSKESAVVGGVAINQNLTAYDKDSPTGTETVTDGAPLFTFFKSKKVASSKNQFVVFITPEIVENAHLGTFEVLQKFKRVR